MYKAMFFDRNVKMALKLEELLKTKQSYFVIVGAGHLVGKKGILKLLNKGDYVIRQL